MKYALVALLIIVAAVQVSAQKNEVAVSAGAYLTQHVNVQNDHLFAIEGNVARLISNWRIGSLWIELPIAGSLDARAKALSFGGNGQFFGTRRYSALFFSPGVRFKFAADSRVSPFVAIGGGLAHFSKSGVPGSTNTNVIDFGVGTDVRISRLLALRGEFRDFYSGPPQIIGNLMEREHQILATGGLVLRF